MQAPKNGFFYVLDRKTGEFLSAEPYVPVNWAIRVDKKTGRPVESGNADYSKGPKLVFPGSPGGHNWQPMAFNPSTKLVYIPAIETGVVYFMPSQPFNYAKGGFNMNSEQLFPAKNSGDWGLESKMGKTLPPLTELARGQPDTTVRGFLRAWDPVAQRVVWQVETSDQWVGELNAIWNGGGVTTTAGDLVFQGRSTGFLYAYEARTGEVLAQIDVGTSIMASPMTYEIDGTQYVAVMAGYGGSVAAAGQPIGTAAYRYGNAGRIVAFKLDGGPVPLPEEVTHATAFPHPAADRFGTPEQIGHGLDLFKRHCAHCHANQASGTIPDLRRINGRTFGEFDDIVLRGSRAAKGMGNFSSLISAADVYDIRAALMSEAWTAYQASQMPAEPQSAPHTPSKAETEESEGKRQ
jgi:quinohemoprotein ethanol dehydrogenase